jgi:hypothetical protein
VIYRESRPTRGLGISSHTLVGINKGVRVKMQRCLKDVLLGPSQHGNKGPKRYGSGVRAGLHTVTGAE